MLIACQQSALPGWQKQDCQELTAACVPLMSAQSPTMMITELSTSVPGELDQEMVVAQYSADAATVPARAPVDGLPV